MGPFDIFLLTICPNIWSPDKIHPTKKKKESRFFHFLELDQIFQLFYLHNSGAQLFSSLCPKSHLIWSKSELVISGVTMECHKCFNMKYGHHQCTDTLYTVDTPNIKRNTCSKIFPFNLPFLGVNSVQLIWCGWCSYFILKHLASLLFKD